MRNAKPRATTPQCARSGRCSGVLPDARPAPAEPRWHRRLTLAGLFAALFAVPAAAAPQLPAALAAALDLGDPSALADTTLPRLGALDSTQRAGVEARIATWPVPRRVAIWAFLQVGTPYRLGALGEGKPPDFDPPVRFDSTDCAVLNLTSVALAHAGDAGGLEAAMAIAQYRGARVEYASRFHFTTDRLDSSAYWRDITRTVGRGACRTQRVRLNRRADGGSWIPIGWERERDVTWLSRESAGRFPAWSDRGRMPEVVGVAFVRRRTFADGLDVVHESLLWRGRTLLHASSTTGRVVTLPLPDYLAGPGRGHDGFVLFEYR